MTSSSGLASGSRSYTYDRDGNRLSKTEAGVTFTSTYDRTDELKTVIKTGGTGQSFTYDAYGNLTGNAENAAVVTAMTYDLADHLTGIDAAGTTNDAAFTLDALGRFRTRTVNSVIDTYSYVGTTETVTRIATGATNTDSIVSPDGDRLGIAQGGTLNWLLPDLHGSVGASLNAAETTIVNAIRYDAYGQTIGTGSAGAGSVGAANWKYQGRLDVSPAGLATPLYDMSARFYSPGIGAFTQLDSVMGSAQNPLSMNRFLYALANPATMIDPTGHAACMRFIDGVCQGYFAKVKHGKLKPGMSGRSWANRRADRVSEQDVQRRSVRSRTQTNGQVAAAKKARIDAVAADDRESRVVASAGTRKVVVPPPKPSCEGICIDPLLVVGGIAAVGATAACVIACTGIAAAAAIGAGVGAAVGAGGYIISTSASNIAAGREWTSGMTLRDGLLAAGTGAVGGVVLGATFGWGAAALGTTAIPAVSAEGAAFGLLGGPLATVATLGFKVATDQPIDAGDALSLAANSIPGPARAAHSIPFGILADRLTDFLGGLFD